MRYKAGDHVVLPDTEKEYIIKEADGTKLYPYCLADKDDGEIKGWFEEEALTPAASGKAEPREFKAGDRVSFTEGSGRIRVGVIQKIRTAQCGPIYSIKVNGCTWEVYGENALSPAGGLIDPKEAASECRKFLKGSRASSPAPDKEDGDAPSMSIGDKVYIKTRNSFGVVTGIISDDSCSVLCRNGLTSMLYNSELAETGERFDIQGILAGLG